MMTKPPPLPLKPRPDRIRWIAYSFVFCLMFCTASPFILRMIPNKSAPATAAPAPAPAIKVPTAIPTTSQDMLFRELLKRGYTMKDLSDQYSTVILFKLRVEGGDVSCEAMVNPAGQVTRINAVVVSRDGNNADHVAIDELSAIASIVTRSDEAGGWVQGNIGAEKRAARFNGVELLLQARTNVARSLDAYAP